jgi:hypothetical protein
VLSFYLLMPFVFMSLFTSDKRFFAADTTARLYHPFQYYMAKVSITLPFNMIVAIVFHLVYYGMIGMRHGVRAMGMSCCISLLMGVTAMQVGAEGAGRCLLWWEQVSAALLGMGNRQRDGQHSTYVHACGGCIHRRQHLADLV